MKQMINTKINFMALDYEKYDMLMDFLEDNNICYEETDFEEYVLDQRSEEEKYEDWLAEECDLHNDNVAMGIE